MDNVIQHIKIEDIVPSNHNYNQIDIEALEDLAISVKNNGIKEPLLLKKINDKYQIISGNKRYRAAILAGLSEVPAIIEDYNTLFTYPKPNDNNYPNSINNNSDIVNLSELNKEYERNDFKMNNEFINNSNVTPQQPTNQTITPTFGGRFFPSLEDEPTNMAFNNVMGPNLGSTAQPSNLIDLTDLGTNMPTQNPPSSLQNLPSMDQTLQSNIDPQNNGNIIDIAGLTQNNSMVTPVQEMPVLNNVDNEFQEVMSDFQSTQNQEMMVPPVQPILEQATPNNPMNINSAPIISEQQTANIQQEQIANTMGQPLSQMSNVDLAMNENVNINQDTMPAPVAQTMVNPISENINTDSSVMMSSPINSMSSVDNSVIGVMPEPIVQDPLRIKQPLESNIVAQEPSNQVLQKNILPVINTLKAVSVNLENFGYTIRITDEDLPTSYKITIEIEK